MAGIFSVIVIVLAIALMLYAIQREKARWLIPHLSAQVFLILFLIIVALVVAVLLAFGAYRGIRNLLGVSNYYISDDC
uniref:Inner membrane protein n=1 Tax=Heterorhabditis bacteriophora TaxID=37862 RepID=A0A1I7WZT5_HETBA